VPIQSSNLMMFRSMFTELAVLMNYSTSLRVLPCSARSRFAYWQVSAGSLARLTSKHHPHSYQSQHPCGFATHRRAHEEAKFPERTAVQAQGLRTRPIHELKGTGMSVLAAGMDMVVETSAPEAISAVSAEIEKAFDDRPGGLPPLIDVDGRWI